MKTILKQWVMWVATVALLLAPATRAIAQDVKPAVVVSIASVDKLMSDVGYLTQSAGVPEYANLVAFLTAQYTRALDGTKSTGVYMTFSGMDPTGVGFLPVKDLPALLQVIEQQVGKAEDLGDGVLKLGLDQPVFIKEQGGYAFVSNMQDNLGNLPADPASLLAGLDKQYNLAVRVNVRNIPEALRKMAVSEIKAGFERQLANQPGDAAQKELQQKLASNGLKSVVSLIEESDQITFGWAVDAQQKTTYMDFSVTAMEGTQLAQQMELLSDAKSDFAGFLVPDAAVTMNFTGKMPQQDVEQAMLMLQAVRQKALQEIDNDTSLPDDQAKALVKDVLGSLLDIVRDTVQSGKMDGGAALMLEPGTVKFAAGGYVADGAALSDAFKKLVDLAKNEPEFPEVNFNADTHGDVVFHTMTVPIPEQEDEARKILGNTLDIALGTGPKSFYLAFGSDSLSTLKQIIDRSSAEAANTVPPAQFHVALAPIMKFAASIEDSPQMTMMVQAIEQAAGKDHVSITAKPIERGVAYRIVVEEGILQLIGQGVKMTQGGAAP